MTKTYSKKVQKEHREMFIDALENGNYKQAREKLMSDTGGVCCLGLACDLSGLGEWEKEDGRWYYVIRNTQGRFVERNKTVLPVAVMAYYGFTSEEGDYDSDTLIRDNDIRKHSFKRIAKTIRENEKALTT